MLACDVDGIDYRSTKRVWPLFQALFGPVQAQSSFAKIGSSMLVDMQVVSSLDRMAKITR